MSPARYLLAGAALLALVAFVALRQQRVLERGLPPRTECRTQAEALTLAGPGALPILGTGSMAPYIPAAAAGRDPLATIVAYAVLRPGATIADVTPGALVTYRPGWDTAAHVIHGAAAQDRDGWIMSGLANRDYENKHRLTAANFTGLVAHVYTWPQP